MKERTLLQRLTDRSFMNTVAASIMAVAGCYSIWQTPGVPASDKINATIAAIAGVATVVSIFTHSEKAKDRAAIEAQNQAPQTLNIGTAGNVDTAGPSTGLPPTGGVVRTLPNGATLLDYTPGATGNPVEVNDDTAG